MVALKLSPKRLFRWLIPNAGEPEPGQSLPQVLLQSAPTMVSGPRSANLVNCVSYRVRRKM